MLPRLRQLRAMQTVGAMRSCRCVGPSSPQSILTRQGALDKPGDRWTQVPKAKAEPTSSGC